MKQEGVLLMNIVGYPVFRVYDEDNNFIDYNVLAQNVSVTIDDDTVELKDGKLDYI